MNVRYRKLKHFVPGVRDILLSFLQWDTHRFPRGPRVPLDDTAVARVVDLEILEDGTGSMEKVRTLVASGELVADDLVDVGRGWESVGDVIEFDDCRPTASSDWLGGKLVLALLIAAVAVVAGFGLLFILPDLVPPRIFARWELLLLPLGLGAFTLVVTLALWLGRVRRK